MDGLESNRALAQRFYPLRHTSGSASVAREQVGLHGFVCHVLGLHLLANSAKQHSLGLFALRNYGVVDQRAVA